MMQLLVRVSLVLGLLGRCAVGRTVELSVDGASSSSCSSVGECVDTIWCLENANRPLTQFKRAFGYVEMCVFPPEAGALMGASSDSWFQWPSSSSLGSKLSATVEGRLAEQRQTVVERLKQHVLGDGASSCVVFSPFGRSCVKAVNLDLADESGVLRVSARAVDFHWGGPALLVAGYALVVLAPHLSERVAFYYLSGVSIGVVLCVFLLTWFVLKRVAPGRNTAWVAVAFQSVFGAAALLNDQVSSLVRTHIDYAAYFLVGAALLSFAVTHYMLRGEQGSHGPSAGIRDIVRWTIQGAGYTLVAWGSRSNQWSVAIVLLALVNRHVRPVLGQSSSRLLAWLNPNRDVAIAKIRYLARPFLTLDEFNVEGQMCTEEATSELYSSREFQQWIVNNADRITVQPRERQQPGDFEDEEDEEEDMF